MGRTKYPPDTDEDQALYRRLARQWTEEPNLDDDATFLFIIDIARAVRKHDEKKCAVCNHTADGKAYCKRHDRPRGGKNEPKTK